MRQREHSIDPFSKRLRARAHLMTPTLARIAQYLDANRIEIYRKSAIEIGSLISVSDASVIRATQALGYDGLRELKQDLAASFGKGETPADNLERTIAKSDLDIRSAINQVLSDHDEAILALRTLETQAQLADAIGILAPARSIGVFGIGPTAHIAHYFAMLLCRAGRKTWVFDGASVSITDQLLRLGEVEALVVMSYGRPYREFKTVVAEARALAIPIVLITDSDAAARASKPAALLNVDRGQKGRVALHGATLVCLECIMVALAAKDPDLALASLKRLSELRTAFAKADK